MDRQKDLREELKDKPDELKRYKDKLKEAIMMDNRMQGYRKKTVGSFSKIAFR